MANKTQRTNQKTSSYPIIKEICKKNNEVKLWE